LPTTTEDTAIAAEPVASTTDPLPLVLLAAAGHPDRAVRDRIARRLDAAIEEFQPLHSPAEVLRRSPLRGLCVEPAICDTVVRVLRLVFSRRRYKIARWRVRILRWDPPSDQDTEDSDLILTHHLKLFDPERVGRRRWTLGRRHAPCRVVTGTLGWRLRQFQEKEAGLRARCWVDNGYCLTFTGRLPWKHSQTLARFSTLDGNRNLALLGFSFDLRDGTLQLRTVTPEATLAFSAALARGGRLWLRDREQPETDAGVVGLRDFDEDEAVLFPAVLCGGSPEPWLQGLPAYPVAVADEDRVEIARWLRLPGCWLTEPLLEKLLTCRDVACGNSSPTPTDPGLAFASGPASSAAT
jgi:hypothetical protein